MRPAINKLSGKPIETQEMLKIGRNANSKEEGAITVSLKTPSLVPEKTGDIVVDDFLGSKMTGMTNTVPLVFYVASSPTSSASAKHAP